jgi:uncharacterized protein (TIGR00375 family)
MDLENLDKWAKVKGIKVLGTGDFTHPEWFLNLKEKLEPLNNGLFKLKDKFQLENNKSEVFFILTAEISCIYSKNGKVRKIHIIVFSPSFEICEKINAHLNKIGNLKSDGRPILGLDAEELAKIVLNISPDCLVVPAHLWTPWFSIFGSKSGFDSIEECFGEYSKYIYAVETGLSSDPAMNWRLSALDKITLISNSDAHSGPKLGREANVFETELSYKGIMEAIKTKDPKKFLYTIEFFPEEGKYHYDGHRICGKSFSPKETKKYNNLCPVCKKPLTIGVLNRVEELADRPEGVKPANAIPFKSLIPLQEIIAGALGVTTLSKKVGEMYNSLINKFGSEFEILLNASVSDLESFEEPRIAEGVKLVREGKLQVEPGYDGVYGKVKIFSRNKSKGLEKQRKMF